MQLYTNYRDTPWLRTCFLDFTPAVFHGASFSRWYELGCWSNSYIPFSFVENQTMLANVSVSEMQVLINHQEYTAIQFATVGTLLEYRNQGLSRRLMDEVLTYYAEKTDLFFLFANDDVLEFYPKFKFQRLHESIFLHTICDIQPNFRARKLDLNQPTDFALLRSLANERLPVTSVFGASDYAHILLWHALYIQPNNIWYLEKQDIIIIFEVRDTTILLYDILSKGTFSFREILPDILSPGITTVDFYFTPDKIDLETQPKQEYTESPLFIRGAFPLQEQDFKFPILAQT